jgi:hypothetical protein
MNTTLGYTVIGLGVASALCAVGYYYVNYLQSDLLVLRSMGYYIDNIEQEVYWDKIHPSEAIQRIEKIQGQIDQMTGKFGISWIKKQTSRKIVELIKDFESYEAQYYKPTRDS